MKKTFGVPPSSGLFLLVRPRWAIPELCGVFWYRGTYYLSGLKDWRGYDKEQATWYGPIKKKSNIGLN